jgi:hypothetical protein
MNLKTFTESRTRKIKEFEHYWTEKIVPYLSTEEIHYWESEASLWDWVDQYEDWSNK